MTQVFLVSLALRLAWAAFTEATPVSDFRGYDTLAVRWLSGGGFGGGDLLAYRTPGYPAFLAGIYLIFGHSWKAAAYVQAFLGAASSGLTTALAGRVIGRRASIIAGLLHALSPTALAYVPVLASENLAVPLLLSGLLLVAYASRSAAPKRLLFAAASGGVLGLLLIVRPAAVVFLPAWLLLVTCGTARGRLRVLSPLVTVAVALLVISPWLVRNHRLGLGPLTLSTAGGLNAWMGNNDEAISGGFIGVRIPELQTGTVGERERERAYWRAAIAWVRSHPVRYLALCRARAVRLLGAEPDRWAALYLTPFSVQGRPAPEFYHRKLMLEGFRAIIGPLILLGSILALWRWRDYAIVLLPAYAYIAALSLSYAQTRFRELSDPLLFIPLAALLSDVLFGTEESGGPLSRKGKVVAAVVLVCVNVALHATRLVEMLYRVTPV